jgi:flavin reductase (DIM6/NTAB) family NADH-FMN oxidoreductase RutF
MARKSFPLSNVYGLLEPGPLVMVTTSHGGHPNIMTMSWHTMMEFEPPLAGCGGKDQADIKDAVASPYLVLKVVTPSQFGPGGAARKAAILSR